MKLKRWLVFGWREYESNGGWNDFQGAFSDIEAAMRDGQDCASAHIVDLSTGKIVLRWEKGHNKTIPSEWTGDGALFQQVVNA